MAKKKEKKAGKRMKKSEMSERLISLFHTKPNETFSLKQLSSSLNLTTHPLKMLCADIITEMIEDDFLQEVEKGHYKLNDHGLIMTGVFQRKSNGKNSFIPDDGGETIFIAERNSAHAMNNDKVKIALFAKRKNRNPEGEVIEILERANDTFVGTLKVEKFYAFLLTENRTLANDIFIPKDKLKGGKNGDKAVVKIVEWPEEAKNPIGQVIDILGKAGENTTEMHAILAEFGLPYVYPKNVETAAEKIPAEISEADYAEREDFRNVTTFTIDPKDAKDFDDALSIRLIKPGLWEVGVHIADVTHYVKEGGVIDKEAEKRATSVYLVDRTIPMLPERLCNFICSLRPDEEKLAFSVIFNMNEKGEVDLPENTLCQMDIAIASIHGPCYKGERTEEAITAAYLAAMENPLIHIIGHPDDGRYPVDYEQLAKKAKETGTILEVNNGSLRPGGFRVDTRKNDLKMLEYCKKYEVPVTMGSDAHMDVDLADYSYALPVIEESHFPEELIVNTSAELLKSCIRYKRNMWKQKKVNC